MHHDPFSLWVAKAIADCGGSAAQYLRGVERKWALTFAATRMVDCQVESYSNEWREQDFAGLSADSFTVFH